MDVLKDIYENTPFSIYVETTCCDNLLAITYLVMAFLPNLVLYYVFVTWINYEKTYAKASNVCENHNYTTISDGRRSTSNLLNATRGDKPICDKTIQDSLWYRFEIANGNQLATKRPEIQHCGTYSPIWMNGSHPTVSQGEVSRKACAYLLVGRPVGCTLSYRIKVLNCSGFYVYRLKPPEQCFLAYCIGKTAKFEEGKEEFGIKEEGEGCWIKRKLTVNTPHRDRDLRRRHQVDDVVVRISDSEI